MHVEIWSDVICPWCYLGKARFETALAAFEHRDEVRVTFRSFELDPSRSGVEPVQRMLAAKVGPQAAAMEERVAGLVRAEGLGYRLDREVGNTFDAHRLLHLARERGLEPELVDKLFEANFAEARPLFTGDTLLDVAAEAGLDRDEASRVLADTDAYADAVRAEEQDAAGLGATGVPFFVLDRRFGIAGGQPVDVFTRALAQAWQARAA
ncbi:DsbA family oxidoreductase [Amycolatopsis sp. FDAARGOS 1241]|uniref:DsbA family oxidoreductase n=1 Tax=Amycolatopsis sp. FDAARGOS 1241 TaxID=2778070 RepID=UPI00194F87C1|nr:DsbA family oxidoreductase [Amycolatopsis sp. FDAARGOS 1241]QRP49769.1 DsbA family oxidoreductase [Amycolatopsis sp. FDAARGOS 1241]